MYDPCDEKDVVAEQSDESVGDNDQPPKNAEEDDVLNQIMSTSPLRIQIRWTLMMVIQFCLNQPLSDQLKIVLLPKLPNKKDIWLRIQLLRFRRKFFDHKWIAKLESSEDDAP